MKFTELNLEDSVLDALDAMLPVINQLSKGGYPADAINCVIMAPTRELAQQIDQQMEGFSYFMPVSSVAIYGGNDGIRFEQEKKGLTLGKLGVR